jgi:hypothetical protein
MRRTTKYFFIGLTLVVIYVLIFTSLSFVINATQNSIATVYVAQVNTAPDFANPGGESFWSGIQSHHIALIQANSYPGSPSGDTAWVDVQMAWTQAGGTPELMIRMEFPSYGSISPSPPAMSVPVLNDSRNPAGDRFFNAFNSSCIYPGLSCYGGVYPQDIGFLPLATGSQYTYPEQAIVMLGIAPGANTDAWYAVSYKPKMVLGTSGGLDTGSGGAAEMWIWSRSPTDNSSSDTYYPGLNFPNGTAVSSATFGMPPNESYAIDGYTNASSFYQLGGIANSSMFPYINTAPYYSGITSGLSLGMNPYEVQAKGVTPSTGGNWVVEFVRSLQTPSTFGENHYQLQMNPSSTKSYHIAFAVSQEAASQTYLIYYNSVSFWYMFNFQTNSGFNGYSNQYGEITNSAGLAGMLFVAIALTYSGTRIDTSFVLGKR